MTQTMSSARRHPPQTHTKNIKEEDIDSGSLQSPGLGSKPEPARQPRPQLIAPLCPAPLASLPASSAQRERCEMGKQGAERRARAALFTGRFQPANGASHGARGSLFPAQQPQFSSGSPQSQPAGHFAPTSQQLEGRETEARLPSGCIGVHNVDSSKKKRSSGGKEIGK